MYKYRAFWTCAVLLVILAVGGVALAHDGDQPTPELLSADELSSRLEIAEVLAECTLPVPALEGSLHEMGENEDVTRTKACINNRLVEGITYSSYPGADEMIRSFQEIKAYWRLVDVATGKIVKKVVMPPNPDDKWINNPRIEGPPSIPFDFNYPCGEAKEFLLLLDVSARQYVGGEPVGGLKNRDHSWRFSLGKKSCNLYLSLVYNEFEEGCPTDVKAKFKATGGYEKWLTFSNPTDTFTGPILVGGCESKVTISYRDNDTVKALPNGWTKLWQPDGSHINLGLGPFVELWGCTDLVGLHEYRFKSCFEANNGDMCCVQTWLKDPPSAAAQKLVDEHGLDIEYARELVEAKMIELGISEMDMDDITIENVILEIAFEYKLGGLDE